MTELQVRVGAFAELPATTVYLICKLRVDVFVVEQQCPYAELDGRDLESGTSHIWLEDAGIPVAYLRLLTEPNGDRRIGRVCVAREHRGRGLADTLVSKAMDLRGEQSCVLDAQAQLQQWYVRRGFVPSGPAFVEDGIPHVPMTCR